MCEDRCINIIAGVKNFQKTHRHLVNYCQWFDNNDHTPELVDEGANP